MSSNQETQSMRSRRVNSENTDKFYFNNERNREHSGNILESLVEEYPVSKKTKEDLISTYKYEEDPPSKMYEDFLKGKVSRVIFYRDVNKSNVISRDEAQMAEEIEARKTPKQRAAEKASKKATYDAMLASAKKEEAAKIEKRITDRIAKIEHNIGGKKSRRRTKRSRRSRRNNKK